jgi:hypothetical protein
MPPKAVWARLQRGPEQEDNPVCRCIDRVRYDEGKARFADWVGKQLGPVRDLRPLFNFDLNGKNKLTYYILNILPPVSIYETNSA